jgi:putative phage-type endonuclease
MEFNEYNKEYVSEMLNVFFSDIYYNNDLIKKAKLNKVRTYFETVEDYDKYYDVYCSKMKLSPEIQLLWNKYNLLKNIPQPVQKSPEWFKARNGMITASSGAQAIGESKYEKSEKFILDKIGYGDKFPENKFVHHGKKYEKIAIMIYEIMQNVKIGEFGLIPHLTIPYLGASPDGISMCSTLDGNESKLVGRMLEIKCPYSRDILTTGKLDGEICPHYYWVQVQLQLECCDLEECDFWQCNIQEYSYEEWLLLKFDKEKYTNQDGLVEFDDIIKKGVVIQFLPIDFVVPDKECIEWYATYIYPPTLIMNHNDYKKWCDYVISNYKSDKYRFDKILYWGLTNCHNHLITRDKEWFETNKNKFKNVWDKIVFLRENQEARDKFVEQYKKKPVVKKPTKSQFFDD